MPEFLKFGDQGTLGRAFGLSGFDHDIVEPMAEAFEAELQATDLARNTGRFLKPVLDRAISDEHDKTENESECQRHYSDRDGNRRTGHEHANGMRKAIIIVDVRKKITFNIEDRAEFLAAR